MGMKRPSGLSLLELVVATFVLLAFFSFVGLLTLSVSSMKAAAANTQAAQLASALMDGVRQMAWPDVVSGTYRGGVPDAAASAGMANQFPPQPYPSLQHVFTVNGMATHHTFVFTVVCANGLEADGVTPMADLKTVQCRVSWLERSRSRELVYGTCVTPGGGL